MPSNLALAVNSKIEYLVVDYNEEYNVISSASYESYKKELEQGEVICKIKGEKLVNKKYKPIFNYFANHNDAFIVFDMTL